MNFSTKILLITTALLLGACSSNDGPTGVTDPVEPPPEDFAMLQALNASPDGPNINVLVGGTAASSDLDFTVGSAEGSGPPGSQPISVEAVIPGVDDDGDPLTEEIIAPVATDLVVDTVTTVVVTGLDGFQTGGVDWTASVQVFNLLDIQSELMRNEHSEARRSEGNPNDFYGAIYAWQQPRHARFTLEARF